MADSKTIKSLKVIPAPVTKAPHHGTRWRLLTSALLSLVTIGLVVLNAGWLADAFVLVRTARLDLLLSAFGTICVSYLVSSQVFGVVLHWLGRRVSMMRLWLTTVTAIVISQSVPAGGVGSYAFLLATFKRRGIPAGEASLLAMLESLSYAVAMLLIGAFAVVYVAANSSVANISSLQGLFIAGAVGSSTIALVLWLLSRPAPTLARCLTRVIRLLPVRLQPCDVETRARALVGILVQNRQLIASRPTLAIAVIALQLLALSGHSFALLLVLSSLGVAPSFAVTLSAFGIALITSTFNVLPGGGGTVETVLVATLLQLSVGTVAVPAAILFRLLNFWALLPVAAGSYWWLMRQPPQPPHGRSVAR